MKTLAIVGLLWLAIVFAPPSSAATGSQMSVLDCFLLLPRDFLAAAPPAWLSQCKIDEKSGSMRCAGSDAQANFQVALFHYADGHPMLAVCQGQLYGNEARFLDFFELKNSQGEMQPLPRSIFPIADADEDKGANWFFELPRQGHTILVHDQASGKVTHRFIWNGEKFAEEK